MDGRPLLAAESPADSTLPPPPSPDPAPVDDDIKNTQEADGCKNGAEPTNKTADVACPVKKEVRKAGSRRWVIPSLFGGRLGTEAGAGDASSSGGKGAAARVPVLSSAGIGLDARKKEIVVDIYKESSSRTLATTASGVVEAEARRSFPSRVLATPLGQEKENELKKLIDRAEVFADSWSGHYVLADPAADLAAALRNFAAAQNAGTADGLGEAAAALGKVAASPKLEEQPAGVARMIASEAAALAAGDGEGADPPGNLPASTSSACSRRSPEILFYLAIPGSVGLLPYLHTIIPKHLWSYVSIVFGTVFSAATVGAVLVARAMDKTDLEMATIVGALCLVAFSVLVIVFLSFALAGGNIVFICVFSAILAAVHIWAWARK